MGKTKNEIVNEMQENMPYHLPEKIRPYIIEAMNIYAKQEAKAYANWLSNQVFAGRTAHKLWIDYELELGAEKV